MGWSSGDGRVAWAAKLGFEVQGKRGRERMGTILGSYTYCFSNADAMLYDTVR